MLPLRRFTPGVQSLRFDGQQNVTLLNSVFRDLRNVETGNTEEWCVYSMEDAKENVGWSIGGGAGCHEWITVPKDLGIAVGRMNILSLPCFSSLHF